MPEIDLSAIAAGAGGFVINGQDAGNYSGFSVAGAGDVNGDGLDDVIVGANFYAGYANPEYSYTGRSYVVFGTSDGTPTDLSAIAGGSGGFVINSRFAYDRIGSSVASAGD